MTIQNHIPEPMLLDYMSAQLSPEFSYVIGCHVDHCPQCGALAAQHLAIGGAALDMIAPVKMHVSAKDVLLNMEVAEEENTVHETHHAAPVLPNKSELFDETILRNLKYQMLGPGVKQHIFKLSDEKISALSPRILWIDPGVAVPSHGHGGTELTQVLVGGFYAGQQSFNKGDIQIVDHLAPHQPTAMDDGPCMVLAAAEAPLKFQNILPRLLQPLFKI